METYSHFFQTLHDEQSPAGYLGRGTHASILRAVVFHDPRCEPLKVGHFADFAVIWDEDHDRRVIQAIERIYQLGFLGSFGIIGERKGILYALVNGPVQGLQRPYLERQLHAVAQGMDDPWSSSLDFSEYNPNRIIDDDYRKVGLYLDNLKMLWNLGVKKINGSSAVEGGCTSSSAKTR
jgi:hypothetical protein